MGIREKQKTKNKKRSCFAGGQAKNMFGLHKLAKRLLRAVRSHALFFFLLKTPPSIEEYSIRAGASNVHYSGGAPDINRWRRGEVGGLVR